MPIVHSAARTWTLYGSTQPLQNDKYRIPKSRYDSVDCYIANDSRNKEAYNDIECPINEKVFERLKGHGALFYLAVIMFC